MTGVLVALPIVATLIGGAFLYPRLSALRSARTTARGLLHEIDAIDRRIDRALDNGHLWDPGHARLSYRVWTSEEANVRAVLGDHEYAALKDYYDMVARVDAAVSSNPDLTLAETDLLLAALTAEGRMARSAVTWCPDASAVVLRLPTPSGAFL